MGKVDSDQFQHKNSLPFCANGHRQPHFLCVTNRFSFHLYLNALRGFQLRSGIQTNSAKGKRRDTSLHYPLAGVFFLKLCCICKATDNDSSWLKLGEKLYDFFV